MFKLPPLFSGTGQSYKQGQILNLGDLVSLQVLQRLMLTDAFLEPS